MIREISEFFLLHIWIAGLLALLISFLLVLTVYRLRRRPRPHRKALFWTSGFLLTLVVTYVLFIIFLHLTSYVPSNTFSQQIWISDPERRLELVNELMHSHRLDGLEREELILLLGEPSTTAHFTDSGRDLVYYLGQEPGPFSIDSEWLLIWLKDGRVDHYKVMTD